MKKLEQNEEIRSRIINFIKMYSLIHKARVKIKRGQEDRVKVKKGSKDRVKVKRGQENSVKVKRGQEDSVKVSY